jgi:hypothetical protein
MESANRTGPVHYGKSGRRNRPGRQPVAEIFG